MLRITAEVRDHMFAHAIQALPNEACGMVSRQASADLVDLFHPVRNAAESETVFVLDGQELLNLERQIDESDRKLVGVVHSHTQTTAYPSPTDIRDVGRFDPSGVFCHLIVSLRAAEPAVRCYTIDGENISELPIVIAQDNDDSQDEGGAVAAAAVMQLPTRE